jgi:hypothetical protein
VEIRHDVQHRAALFVPLPQPGFQLGDALEEPRVVGRGAGLRGGGRLGRRIAGGPLPARRRVRNQAMDGFSKAEYAARGRTAVVAS